MSADRLGEALATLRVMSGLPEGATADPSWTGVLNAVAGHATKTGDGAWQEVLCDRTGLPDRVVEVVAEALGECGRDRRRAGALQSLAAWWPGEPVDSAWAENLERRREELMAIRGIGHEVVDRILLDVLGLRVIPISRAMMRVACRHGWAGLEWDYEEWQHLFLAAAERGDIGPSLAYRLLNHVGATHCRAQPDCGTCPLECLLPENGPYDPE